MKTVFVISCIIFLTGVSKGYRFEKQAAEICSRDGYRLNTHKALKTEGLFHISGKVTRSFTYCGGANPPQEVLKSLAARVPFPDKKFHLRKGTVNSISAGILMSFISDSLGMFSFDLPPGTYSIILDEQAEPLKVNKWERPNLQIDEKCLKEWWRKPYKILEVKNHDLVLPDFHFQQQCFIDFDIPCIMYTGPQPQ